ncbi:MAG: hypothetical protein ACOZEN_05565 [Thermodesulfobacteriota bacterium]
MYRILTPLARCAALAVLVLTLAAASANAQEGQDMELVSKDASINAVVGEEDGEGLWVVAPDGTSYSVWTPEEVSLETLSAFQQNYKNKEVTLVGDVYKDRFGNLNLFVKSLPN